MRVRARLRVRVRILTQTAWAKQGLNVDPSFAGHAYTVRLRLGLG